ncbi:MAG: GNAT family N-acetyltransferase [Clostridiales bacterium]|nr:GNAT family N-acetyltransferase [Clostridiales bacterium]MCD8223819.1 GNAT family N-acetyltransferase [Clostridiales bacterium]
MSIIVKKYESSYLAETRNIWNEVVEDGVAFPQLDCLDAAGADAFFNEQTYTGIAVDTENDRVLGMYILHPNNVGRCGHIANASFAVSGRVRGLHIGEKLVCDCLEQARQNGFAIMQFNAVVDNNIHARHLYERLGFRDLGTIPGGFRMKDGHYEDIHVMYKTL